MKKSALLLFTVLFISGIGKAQKTKTIVNGDFENWDSTAYTDLMLPWITENSVNLIKDGIIAVTKVPGKVGSAVRLQTYVKGKDTIVGTVIIGGAPYSQMPTGVSGYYKCHSIGKDTAFLAVEFIQGGNAIDYEVFPFSNSDTTTFTAFNFKLANPLSVTPDSVLVGAVSSNEVNYVDITPGSWLELDQLAFTGTGITQPIPDGGFENWATVSLNIPIGWQSAPTYIPGSPTGVVKVGSAYSGKYAVSITSQQFQTGAQLTNGNFDANGNLIGGTPYSTTIDTLIGYYKYIPSGLDSGGILVTLQNNGNIINAQGSTLAPAAKWTAFSIPLLAGGTPDTMRIDLYSSTNYSGIGGSTLIIDDLQLKSQLHNAGIINSINTAMTISAFPNPAQDHLNIHFSGTIPSEYGIRVYNAEGKLMMENNYQSGSSLISLPIAQLATGLYFYEVAANGNVVRNKFVKN